MTRPRPYDDSTPTDLAAMFSTANDLSSSTQWGDGDGTTQTLFMDPPAEAADTPTAVDVFAPSDEGDAGDEPAPNFAIVTNPGLTVSVSADLAGGTRRVDLSPDLGRMTESRLSQEIIALANVARVKGGARLLTVMQSHAGMAAVAQRLDVDLHEDLPEFLEVVGMPLPTPDEADATQAEVFATLYAPDN